MAPRCNEEEFDVILTEDFVLSFQKTIMPSTPTIDIFLWSTLPKVSFGYSDDECHCKERSQERFVKEYSAQ